MFKFVIDDEIYLMLIRERDAEELFNLVDSSREYLREWLPWVDGTKDVDTSREFISAAKKQFAEGKGFQAGIWYKEKLVGIIGFHGISMNNRNSSIGYWLHNDYQGNGIMTRACEAAVNYGFGELQLNRIEIRCAEGNYKSRAIPERLGFVREGIAREAEWLYDHFVNHIVYSKLESDTLR
jgi:ribosomal-protein-serine acetyltransferase